MTSKEFAALYAKLSPEDRKKVDAKIAELLKKRGGGDGMNEEKQHNIPLDAIAKGRALDAVLAEYQRVLGEIQEAATATGISPDEIFADTMMIAAYRIYLLSVEDGMKEAQP